MANEGVADATTLARRARDLATLSFCLALYNVLVLLLVALYLWRTLADQAFPASAFGNVLALCCKVGLFFSLITLLTALMSGHASLRLGSATPAHQREPLAIVSLIITYAILALGLLGCAAYALLFVTFLAG